MTTIHVSAGRGVCLSQSHCHGAARRGRHPVLHPREIPELPQIIHEAAFSKRAQESREPPQKTAGGKCLFSMVKTPHT